MLNKNTISFAVKVAESIGNPAFIKTLIDADKKVFAIQACKQTDLNAVKFSKPKAEQKTNITISHSALRIILRTLMTEKWDEEHRYKIPARIFADAKAAVF